ncbi:CRISPR/Cas system-associated endonuclease Cas3-HD [Rhizobium sp. BK650]|nr:CRISPR/Cas system-associated endonuclease Cas3-HD [Rhizobium sp. BK650]
MVVEDRTLLEVQQANLCLIEDTRIVVSRILRQDLGVPVPQATDAELIAMIFHQLKAA